MSILPYVLRDFWEDPWSGLTRPSRLFDQGFGNVLTDDELAVLNRFGPGAVRRPPQESGMSEVVNNENEFRIGLDVRQFKPEELKVTTKDNRVIINAKHEERPDEHGYIMREFTRQYVLPKDVDPNTVTSGLSPDGVLTVKAPKKALEAPQERSIPITHEPGDQKSIKK
ncbi:hypothetical protein BaRGS_00008667 [Batillaria attramentaria]|uniref:SHSP domain-containing protein n=1 Tax=Batillaria attramentaria TaxID=370345 RepID=A0ABD0LKV1_9CAEN|nr:hypothetical protein BaRGS_009356 [Batillaria attramentaria]